ncbi:MAG: sugar ABC transporter permease [Pyrinomonadaceae bacterium]
MNEEKTTRNIEALRSYIMIAILCLIWIYFHFATDSSTPSWPQIGEQIGHLFGGSWITDGIFLTPRNLSNLMTQMSVTAIIAVGMLMVIVSGNIDLSVGSLLGFAGGIAAYSLTVLDYGLPASIIAAIVIGIAVGAFHGVLTAYFNIPAFIVTLGGLLVSRGAVKWLLGGNTIPISNETFKAIGQSYIGTTAGWVLATLAVVFVLSVAFRRARSVKKYGLVEPNYAGEALKTILPLGGIIAFVWVMNSYEKAGVYVGVPIPVLILLAVALFGGFLTNSTVFGRYLYAIGGNAEAARLSGIDNKRNILKIYALLGGLTGIAALIFTARVGSAAPDAGVLKELDAIAACVIGGASLMGGRGTIFGACLGALIMASLDNGMSLLNVRDFMQDIIKGAILVAAVGLDMMGRRPS